MFIAEKMPTLSCHASTLAEAEPGKFVAAWFGGKSEGSADVRIWSSRFDGTSWTEPEVVAEEAGQPCWNPVLFPAKQGGLLLWYKAGPRPTEWTGFVRRSADGGKTWSKPEILPAGQYGPVRCKPIRRADGAILAGTSVESYRAWAGWVDRSTDDGATWRRFGPLAVPDRPFGLIQPTLFETKDAKKVVALCRSRGVGAVCRAESEDGGETWGPAAATDLPNPNSGIDVTRGSDGALYLVYNHTKTFRTPLNLARSADDGATWKPYRALEEGLGEFSYPAIVSGSDGRLHVTYTWNRLHVKYVAVDVPKGK